MKRVLAFLFAVGALAVVSTEAQVLRHKRYVETPPSERPAWFDEARKFRAHPSADPSGGSSTVQYDPGTPGTLSVTDPGFTFLGNMFDTRNGNPLGGGSLTGISWYQGQAVSGGKVPSGTATQAYLVLGLPGSITMGGLISGINSNAFNSLSGFSPIPVGSTFFVGLNAPGAPTQALGPAGTFGSLGATSATVSSQGHHAAQFTFTGNSSASLPSRNVVLRVSGNFAIPVELLEFELED